MSNVMNSRHKIKTKLKLGVGRTKSSRDHSKPISRKQETKGNRVKRNLNYKDTSLDGEVSSRKSFGTERKFPSRNDSLNEKNSRKDKDNVGKHLYEFPNRRESHVKGRFSGRKDSFNEKNSRKGNYNEAGEHLYELSNRRESPVKWKFSGRNDSFNEKSSRKVKCSDVGEHLYELPNRGQSPVRGRENRRERIIKEKGGIEKSGKSSIYNRGKNTVRGSDFDDEELSTGKSFSVEGRKLKKDYLSRDRESGRALTRDRESERALTRDRENGRALRSKDMVRSAEVSDGKERPNTNLTEMRVSRGRDIVSAGDDLSEKNAKIKSSKYGPILNYNKKRTSYDRSKDNGHELADEKPRKRKKVIRIGRHDISNKRLDDSTPTEGKVVEKSIEISKNAQFRAIEPSPSILSFVEDNLLGRRRLIDLRRAGYDVKLSAPLDNVPFSTSLERERIEDNVFKNKLTFFAAAKVLSSFPPPDLPEIAFAGRSNVGKSSLLNALTRQWGVVRTSDKPGLTQTINFFHLASKLCLVDLPGYGFAYAKEEVKDAWEELVKEYVSTRVGLKKVCLLIDTQWGMKPRDYELIELMERSQTKYQIVLTKTDAVFPINVARRAMQIEEKLQTNKSVINPVMMVSSKSGAGIRALRTVLSNLTRLVK